MTLFIVALIAATTTAMTGIGTLVVAATLTEEAPQRPATLVEVQAELDDAVWYAGR